MIIFAACQYLAPPAQVKVNLYLLIQTTQTEEYEVPRVSGAVFPQHVPLLHGVRNVRNDAGLVLPSCSSLKKHLNNNDRKCVWYKVGGIHTVYVYMIIFGSTIMDPRKKPISTHQQPCFLERYIAMILTALCHSKFLGKSYTPSTALVIGVFLTAIG